MKSQLNSWTEWGNLKEVVVGHCSMLDVININHSFRFFFKDNIQNNFLEKSLSLKKRFTEQRQEDLDEISKQLSSMGISVKRPTRLKMLDNFRTPFFEEELIGAENIRDQTMIIGNEIIETSPIWNRRYFENELLKDIFIDHFNRGAKWTAAPKSRMREEDYDFNFISGLTPKQIQSHFEKAPKQYDIMFDGAQCLRFGYDIVMNVSCGNHWSGLKWLQRQLGENFSIHPVNLTDHHIDGMMIPLREGLMLINHFSMAEKIKLLPDWLQKWDYVRVSTPHKSEESDEFKMASANINVNVLSLSPKKVMIFEEAKGDADALAESLMKYDIEPVVVRLRHSRIFGGGLHCVTIDTIREDVPKKFSSVT